MTRRTPTSQTPDRPTTDRAATDGAGPARTAAGRTSTDGAAAKQTSNGGQPTRRSILAAGGTATAGLLAGCLGVFGGSDDATQEPGDLPTVENPPDVVYVPSHREAMEMLDPVQAGDYVVSPMISYAHSFSTITDGTVEPVEVGSEDDVHLMATVWDAESETVLPTDEGITMRVRRDGELVDERSPWSMLSQTMGFHFGDNVPLDGDGTYALEIELPPPSVRTTGAFEGRFESFETASLQFTYDQDLRDRLFEGIEYVDEEHRGAPGALEPGHGGMDHGEMGHGDEMDDGDGMGDEEMDGGDGMGGEEMDGEDGMDSDQDGEMDHDDGSMDHDGHAMPVSSLPAPDELPGTLQHDADDPPRSDDADVAVSVVESFHGDSPYLLVSPRTPYNAIPLPSMTISAIATRDGTEVASSELGPTLDDEAGFHYGTAIDDLEPGDELTVRIDAPPQVARHQGYETAFVDMPAVELTVTEWDQ